MVRDLDQAAEVVNELASEHVLVLLPDPEAFVAKIRNAGALFLGRATAVPFGDYGVASNHVLPPPAPRASRAGSAPPTTSRSPPWWR